MEILLAVAGLVVMAMVIAGMILLTPSETTAVRETYDEQPGQGAQLSPQPGGVALTALASEPVTD